MRFIKNEKKNEILLILENKILKMGCQTSLLSNNEIEDSKTNKTEQQQFKLTYRQFIMNSRGQVFKSYHFSSLIHRSPSSAIRKVFHRINNIERVCKMIGVDSLKEFSCMQEIEVLKNIDHPNVVKIEEYFVEKHFVYIVFEKINGFSLEEGMSNIKQISLANIINIMKQLLSVVNMMHHQNIAHRNIHPGHIMLIPKRDKFILKLIDFSWSASPETPKMKAPRPYKLSKAYDSIQSQKCPFKHDIYCCGLVFLTLLGGLKQLKNIRGKEEQLIEKILSGNDQIKGLSPLLSGMLNKISELRPPVSQIINYQIFMNSHQMNEQKGKIIFENLRKCNITDRLKSTLWMFATIKLYTFHNKIELMNQFFYLDKNKDGKIQKSELIDGLANIFKMEPEEAQKQADNILHLIDKNNSGQLDFYEFAMGAYSIGRNLSESELRVLFWQIDANKDGIITSAELNEVVEGIEQFQLLSKVGNKLTFEDFKEIMTSYIYRISETN